MMLVTLPARPIVSAQTVTVLSSGIGTGSRVSVGWVMKTGMRVVSLAPRSVQTTTQTVSTMPPLIGGAVMSTQLTSSPGAAVTTAGALQTMMLVTLPSRPMVSAQTVMVLSSGMGTGSRVSTGWVTVTGMMVVSLAPRSVQTTTQTESAVPPGARPVRSTQPGMSIFGVAVTPVGVLQIATVSTLPSRPVVSTQTVRTESAGTLTGGPMVGGSVVTTGIRVVSLRPFTSMTTRQTVSTVPPVVPVSCTQGIDWSKIREETSVVAGGQRLVMIVPGASSVMSTQMVSTSPVVMKTGGRVSRWGWVRTLTVTVMSPGQPLVSSMLKV